MMDAAPDHVGSEHRHHGQGQQQGGGEGEDDGQRHRAEHLSFQPLQGQQGQENDDDDDDAGCHRGGDFARGAVDQVQRRQVFRRIGELALDVLNHHHRRIDQHADGDGQAAETHQVGRESEYPHQDEGGERRERQHQRYHQRAAQVAEEGEQQQDDEHDGFQQRFGNGTDGAADQIAAVVEGFDGGAFRERRRDLRQLRLDPGHHALCVGAAQSEHQALDRFALTILGHGAVAGQRTETDFRDVADAHDIAILCLNDNGAYVVEIADRTFGPHQQRFLAIGQAAGAIVAVVRFQRRAQLLDRQAAHREQLRLRDDLEGAYFAAQAVHIGNAGNRAQLRTDDPVQQRPLFGQRQLAFDGEHEHLAQRRGDRRHAAGNARRQVVHRRGQAFADLLARPVDVGAVLEIDGDVGQRVLRGRAQQALARDAEQLLLDRHGEPGLDFLRRHAGGLQDDLDLRRRDIRKGVDRQAEEGMHAGADQHDGQHQDEQALGQRKTDQCSQHHSLPTPLSMALSPDTPLTAIRSPLAMPSMTTPSPLWLTMRTGCAEKLVPFSSLAVCTKTSAAP